ncbi:MAG: M18 family aminopeptidase [Magnetococcales bacterium]|nr:M18 family aminopeptidase [Magnetococcales bacterium]
MTRLQAAPTPFHAVAVMSEALSQSGFKRLEETDNWQLIPGQGYYVIRDFGSLIAFVAPPPGKPLPVRMAGTHTDSPVLKLKPNALKKKQKLWTADVQLYGGILLSTWFDRDLSLAGLVTGLDKGGDTHHQLVDLKEPLAVLPNLAIHLNRGVNEGVKINTHEQMNPVLFPVLEGEEANSDNPLTQRLLSQLAEDNPNQPVITAILDWELCFYDLQPPALIGLDRQWLTSARLDNLLSCFVGLEALLNTSNDEINTDFIPMLACFNHEEVGSTSATGAASNFAESVLHRIFPDPTTMARAIAASWMISIDNAHACHPNYPATQDEQHCPDINGGPVIKTNANQRYATTTLSSGFFKGLCHQAGVPVQNFTVRADMPCGSTIGPMLSSRLGMKTVDIGVPTWAMHSIREVAGVNDLDHLYKVLIRFFHHT